MTQNRNHKKIQLQKNRSKTKAKQGLKKQF